MLCRSGVGRDVCVGSSSGQSEWGVNRVVEGVDDVVRCSRVVWVGQSGLHPDEALEVERAYQYVLSDPAFRVGTRPDGPLSLNAKRFIVEMYERFTNKTLLE